MHQKVKIQQKYCLIMELWPKIIQIFQLKIPSQILPFQELKTTPIIQ